MQSGCKAPGKVVGPGRWSEHRTSLLAWQLPPPCSFQNHYRRMPCSPHEPSEPPHTCTWKTNSPGSSCLLIGLSQTRQAVIFPKSSSTYVRELRCMIPWPELSMPIMPCGCQDPGEMPVSAKSRVGPHLEEFFLQRDADGDGAMMSDPVTSCGSPSLPAPPDIVGTP